MAYQQTNNPIQKKKKKSFDPLQYTKQKEKSFSCGILFFTCLLEKGSLDQHGGQSSSVVLVMQQWPFMAEKNNINSQSSLGLERP